MSDSDTINNLILNSDIKQVSLEDEMKKSYLDYAMSVIVSRALPDVRDGLKPVHRRIIYSMFENSYFYNRPFRKSARIVGDVMGKYHPHGDSAIYDAMVRLTQDFSLRLPLINGQGNFGSMDGDPAAAMRYTEARMALSSHYLVEDLDKETVVFRPNYDDSEQEPTVLPAQFPNILVNGSSGIAVGMATNIPTHNLGELIDATLHLLQKEDADILELLEYVKGPDFPTGGKIIGKSGIYSYLTTGRGSITISSVAEIEEGARNTSNIIIKEIPWQINKSKLVEEISKLREKGDGKSMDVISTVRDESDRHGVRVVIELKRDAEPELVINYLQKYTPFQVSFGSNMLALDNGIPKLMNLKDMLVAFIAFRREVVRNRTTYLLKKAREKAHIYSGLGIAVENIDEVIELIRNASNPAEAKEKLMATHWRAGQIESYINLLDEQDRKVENGNYYLSESQAKAILDLRLHRLTGLEREKIMEELEALANEIKEYLLILNSKEKVNEIINSELTEIKNKFATPRKTSIEEYAGDLSEEDFVASEDMIITLSNSGYIKRVPVSSYRAQRRGGKGKMGMNTKEEDFVTNLFVVNTHDDILFFTAKGIVYKLKCFKIPESSLTSIGRAIVNLLSIDKDDRITTILPISKSTNLDTDLVFATKQGNIRRNQIKDFLNVNVRGKIAIKLDDNDLLVNVHIAESNKDVLISTKQGKSIRFSVEEELRVFKNRASSGVRGIKLTKDDEVINMSIVNHEKIEELEKRDQYLSYALARRRGESVETTLPADEIAEFEAKEEFILTVTSKGFGKVTSAYEYRITGRGGSGFLSARLSPKNGDIVATFTVTSGEEIMIMSDKGKVIRLPVEGIRITGRVSVGVLLFRAEEDESVISVSKISNDSDDDTEDLKSDDKANDEKQPALDDLFNNNESE
ncbi:DNA gyrase subunit A [Rickettsiales bacterium LUAb2]